MCETVIPNKNGTEVVCYGHVMDDSNFHVVCEDEEEDGVWADGNPKSEDYTFSSWQDVVDTLQEHFASDIVEITAI